MSPWSEGARRDAFGAVRKAAVHLDAVERVKDWTHSRFALAEDEVIMVTEMARSLPGCPPQETVVAFWTADGTRHHFKVFKRVEDVLEEDLPPAWLKGALAASDAFCECC